jgi:hypothetical protein
MKNRVAVITPTINKSKWLDRAVNSVAAFESVDHYICCPKTEFKSVSSRFPQSKVMCERGANGVYGAIDDVIRSIQGEYDWFTWINDDDYLINGFQGCLDSIGRHPEKSLVYGKIDLVDSNESMILSANIAKHDFLCKMAARCDLIPVFQQGALFKISEYVKFGGFDLRFYLSADTRLINRIIVNGCGTMYVGKTVAAYTIRRGQLSSQKEITRPDCDETKATFKRFGLSRFLKHLCHLGIIMSNLDTLPIRVVKHGFRTTDRIQSLAR